MAETRGAKAALATVIGWVIFAIIALFVLRLFAGTIVWLFRVVVAVLVVGGLLALYIKLKTPDEP
jgi:hypothetical protein